MLVRKRAFEDARAQRGAFASGVVESMRGVVVSMPIANKFGTRKKCISVSADNTAERAAERNPRTLPRRDPDDDHDEHEMK